MSESAVHPDALTDAVLRMRRVGEPEAPFTGWLARVDGAVVQLVDTAELRHWPGWRARGEHVLAVHDVVRTRREAEKADTEALSRDGVGSRDGWDSDRDAGGHEAVIAWCVERVDAFLARRRSGGADLSAGEVVTIAVSLIRGCVAARGTRLTGAWWLTQDGTPTFVCGRARAGAPAGADEAIGDAAGSLLESLASAPVVTSAWRLPEIASLLRVGGDPTAAEAHLFAVTPPEPLVLAPLTPRRAAEARQSAAIQVVEPARRGSLWGRLIARHVDIGVGEMVSDAFDGARRATERARRRIARPWLVAVGIAGLIVVGGLAWPTSTAPPASARPGPSASSTSPPPSPSARADGEDPESVDHAGTAGPGEGSVDAEDPALALSAALDVLGSCRDIPCAKDLFEDAVATELPPGAVDLPREHRSVALLDDLGGVAILSVTAVDGTTPAQLVVLVRSEQRWLIRDVRAVEGP